MTDQLAFDGMPEPINMGHGYLYVGATEDGIIKIGIAATFKNKGKRFASHRKASNGTMREYMSRYLPNVHQEEAALKRMLAEYVIAGTEWLDPFKPTAGAGAAYCVETIIHYMEARGADSYLFRVHMAQVITRRLTG